VSLLKKIIGLLTLGVITLLVWAYPVFASRPRGLDDRGPLTKITFIHYRRAYAKPPGVGNKPGGGSSCYGFLASGAKWKTPETFWGNASGSSVPSSEFQNALNAGVAEWESNSPSNIFDGTAIMSSSAPYDPNSMDDKNVAVFGAYSNPGVIAVTTVWGYFYGPPKTRELVEWDMLFNTAGGWGWGDGEANPALMDLQNIATHELGHSAGMDDLYNTSCNLETMYGYSTEGEIIKRDLNAGDIAGIKALYK
jgi:hypothetical protein